MAAFTWTAKNKKTGKSGGRFSRNADVSDVPTMTKLLRQAFPNVEVLDVTIVEEQPAPEPDGASEPGEHVETRAPVAPLAVEGRPVRFDAVPPEDFEVGPAAAARAEIAETAGDVESPE